MGINFQGVSSPMALLALQNFARKICRFQGGGNSSYSVYMGGSGPHGRPEVASGRGMPPGRAFWCGVSDAAAGIIQLAIDFRAKAHPDSAIYAILEVTPCTAVLPRPVNPPQAPPG